MKEWVGSTLIVFAGTMWSCDGAFPIISGFIFYISGLHILRTHYTKP